MWSPYSSKPSSVVVPEGISPNQEQTCYTVTRGVSSDPQATAEFLAHGFHGQPMLDSTEELSARTDTTYEPGQKMPLTESSHSDVALIVLSPMCTQRLATIDGPDPKRTLTIDQAQLYYISPQPADGEAKTEPTHMLVCFTTTEGYCASLLFKSTGEMARLARLTDPDSDDNPTHRREEGDEGWMAEVTSFRFYCPNRKSLHNLDDLWDVSYLSDYLRPLKYFIDEHNTPKHRETLFLATTGLFVNIMVFTAALIFRGNGNDLVSSDINDDPMALLLWPMAITAFFMLAAYCFLEETARDHHNKYNTVPTQDDPHPVTGEPGHRV